MGGQGSGRKKKYKPAVKYLVDSKADRYTWRNTDRSNYLKWYPRLKRVLAAKKGIRDADLELMLYLYDFTYFEIEDLMDVGIITTRGVLLQALHRLGQAELVRIYEQPDRRGGRATKYRISQMGKLFITRLYRILNGEEEWPTE
jgi:hypothetical protein|tara:strand:+ start:625 stop:1056 length:432 start_codon:yes stop_codon:yes gene_type:complete